MARYLTCRVCHQKFDADIIQAFKIGNRAYIHYSCKTDEDGEIVPLIKPELTEAQKKRQSKKELENYIKKLFNYETIPARVKRQIDSYQTEYKYTYSGMLKTLIWWYEIKGNSLDKANGGIGIVPYIYQDACDYYYTLYLAETANSIEKLENLNNNKIINIEIESPQAEKRIPRLFDFEEWEENNE